MTTDIEKQRIAKKLSDKLIDEDIEIVLAVTKARDLVNETLGLQAPKAQWWLDDPFEKKTTTGGDKLWI